MKKPKPKTVITVPAGRILIYFVASVVLLIIVLVWTVAIPDDLPEKIVNGIGCAVGLFLVYMMLTSKNIETVRPLREGIRLITPGLWQGALGYEQFSFDKYDLDLVVDLRDDRECPDGRVSVPAGKRYMRWPMAERGNIDPEEVEVLCTFLANKAAYKKVGVFCCMGVNRSGFICTIVARKILERAEIASEETKNRVWTESFIDTIKRYEDKVVDSDELIPGVG